MISLDEAITIGLKRYRECYPPETIPKDLESKADLTGTPGEQQHIVNVSYSVVKDADPFVLFQANVERATGKVTVNLQEPIDALSDLEIDDGHQV